MRSHLVDALAAWLGRPLAALLTPSWFTCAALACLVAAWLAIRAARRDGDDVPAVIATMMWVYLATLGCGIALPALFDAGRALAGGRAPHLHWAGMVSYCGFAGGIAAAYLATRRARLSLARFGDLTAAPLAIALAIARLGCFLGGCDYGQVSAAPWAVRFPAGSPAYLDHVGAGLVPATRVVSLPVHPTQLYEALLGLTLFAALTWLGRTRRMRDGARFVVLAAGYALGRLAIETLRGDAGRGLVGDWSSAQLVCAGGLLAVAAVVVRARAAPAALAAALLLAAPRPTAAEPAEPRAQVGALLGASSPLNRRAGQVPALAGGALTAALWLERSIALELDVASMANEVATHGSLLGLISLHRPLGERAAIGVRLGIGATVVNFDDPAFVDVVAPGGRLGLDLSWAVSDRWHLVVRPATIDWINAPDLGGPLVTYDVHVGVAFRLSRPAPTPAYRPPMSAPGSPGAPSPVSPQPAPPPTAPPGTTPPGPPGPIDPYQPR